MAFVVARRRKEVGIRIALGAQRPAILWSVMQEVLMTPEQVVAASKRTAQLLPEKDRPRLPPRVTAVTGEYQDGSLNLHVTFTFDIASNGLVCVTYGVGNHAFDEAFKAALVKRYGPPQKTSGVAFLGATTSVWKTATDQVEATFAKDDPAYAMQCSLKK